MKLDTIPSEIINILGLILRENKYFQEPTEKRLQYKFGNWMASFAPTFLFPLFALQLAEEKSSLDTLLLFFYCGYPVHVKKLKEIFSEKTLNDLSNNDLITIKEDKAKANIQIIPFDDLFIATEKPTQDEKHVQHLSFEHDAVMTLFPDSYDLAKHIKTQKVKKGLDLFCGNGVQALVLAKQAESVLGVDANERALQFARFNALLNDIHNVKFEYCDISRSISHLGRFDLVVANPPFCPAIEQVTLFCDGGPTGDYFVKLLLEKQLTEVVEDGGRASMVFPLSLKHEETAAKKLESFHSGTITYKSTLIGLGGANNELNSLHAFLVYFIASRNVHDLQGYATKLSVYYKHLQSQGIVGMTYNILQLDNIRMISQVAPEQIIRSKL